jgi:hypothetical protein
MYGERNQKLPQVSAQQKTPALRPGLVWRGADHAVTPIIFGSMGANGDDRRMDGADVRPILQR